MSSAPPPVPDGLPQNINISGSGHVVNFGGNIQQQTATSSIRQRYAVHMAAHKWFYWILHFIVAVLAAAAWEYRSWLLHLVK
jgi:hypothetical protein